MVPSGSPSPPYFLVTSWPRMVPTVRLTLRIATCARTGSPLSIAGWQSGTSSVTSSDFSSPWFCCLVWCRSWSGNAARSGACRIGVRSRPAAFQWLTASTMSSAPTWPIASSRVRKPSSARYSRTSSAMNSKKFTTCSAWPV